MRLELAGEGDRVALVLEARGRGRGRIGQRAHHPHHRRRVDRPVAGLVVERHVAAHHRNAERLQRVGHPGHRALELPRHVGLLRVAEVQAVGEAERLGADAGEVGRALEHRLDRAPVGVARHAAAVAVDRHGDGALRPVVGELEHRGVGLLGAAHRARLHHRVVLLEQRPARADVGRAEQGEQRPPPGPRTRASRPAPGRSARSGSAGSRSYSGQSSTSASTGMSPTTSSPSSTRRRRESVTSPIAVERTSQRSQTSWSSASLSGSTTHSIRSWDSEIMISNGSMSSSRSGTFDTSMSRPTSPLDAISDEEDESPAAPRSCSEASVPRSSSSRQHSSSRFSSNGSPICTDGRLEASSSSSSADASTDAPPMPSRPGARAHQHQHVAHPGGRAADQAVLARDAQAHRVHQAVLLVGALEVDLAADRGHADRVAVVADAGHRAVEQEARPGRVELAEAQRVEHRDRPRADGEHVAQDAADAGGGALERLHRAGVVVRLDLEGDRQAVAHRDRAGVLARAHQQVRALGGQAAEQLLRVLVGAVLGPHQREHGQLERRWARGRASRRSARTRRR